MTKAIVFGDLHIHTHKESVNRLYDCLEVLKWIFEEAIKAQAKHIIFLGDLFHERSKIDVLNYLRTFEVFMQYMLTNPQFEIWLLIGNHDMYHRETWDVNSVKPLSALPNVHIIDEPTSLKIGKNYFDFCPHAENPVRELEKLKKIKKSPILFGHMSVHGAELNKLYGTKSDVIVEYDNDMVQVGLDLFEPWDRTFLGHYHGAQVLDDKVEYLGSPLQLSFGEAFQDKHIMLFDLETYERKYIVNSFSPKHFILGRNDLDQHDLTGHFVRVVMDDWNAQDVVDIKREIATGHKVASLDFTQREKRKVEKDQQLIEEAKLTATNEPEMLENYIKRVGVPQGLEEKKLQQIGLELCQNEK